jgi:Sphingolipid Delta4-desaturase (DES)
MADLASASRTDSHGANDFLWTSKSEPHLTRRRAILAKYGEQVRALYGTDWTTGAQVRVYTAGCLDILDTERLARVFSEKHLTCLVSQ